uniref:Uncharacterized protein n=1 Tax=Siphoviridae sp. ctkcl3 TaxID=2826445 RepID=A0A8S5LYN5_9CAUD|nr:MAG TPA: hypothetical protein [Siphoviridae sp. ctkcl3]
MPVTFVVVVTNTEPSGLVIDVFFNSKSPNFMAFCVG